jgi:hypothetical protein
MPYVPPWIQQPDFIGAANAGAHIGLSAQEMQRQSDQHAAELALRADELAARMGQENASRAQEQNQFEAGNALREAAQRNSFLLGQQENQNTATRNAAVAELDREKVNQLKDRGIFVNSGNGIFEKNPVTGKWSNVPGSTRPPAPVPVYVPPVAAIPATEAQPADVTSHWIRNLIPFGAHVPDTTNSPAIEANPGRPAIPGHYERMSAADALQTPVAAPAIPQPASGGVTIRDKATGKTFIYSGNPADIPLDTYQIIDKQ